MLIIAVSIYILIIHILANGAIDINNVIVINTDIVINELVGINRSIVINREIDIIYIKRSLIDIPILSLFYNLLYFTRLILLTGNDTAVNLITSILSKSVVLITS